MRSVPVAGWFRFERLLRASRLYRLPRYRHHLDLYLELASRASLCEPRDRLETSYSALLDAMQLFSREPSAWKERKSVEKRMAALKKMGFISTKPIPGTPSGDTLPGTPTEEELRGHPGNFAGLSVALHDEWKRPALEALRKRAGDSFRGHPFAAGSGDALPGTPSGDTLYKEYEEGEKKHTQGVGLGKEKSDASIGIGEGTLAGRVAEKFRGVLKAVRGE